MNRQEKWRQIPSFPNYEVSNLGQVRRRPMRQKISNRGYAQVYLWRGERRITTVVHRLVLEAFRGAPPSTESIGNHLNGVKTDNRLENLAWASQSENQRHSFRVLGREPGGPPGKRGLTGDQLEAIRATYASGNVTLHGLAKLFKVGPRTVAEILGGPLKPGARAGRPRIDLRSLTSEQERELCALRDQGVPEADLAARFNISTQTIRRIRRRNGKWTDRRLRQ